LPTWAEIKHPFGVEFHSFPHFDISNAQSSTLKPPFAH
jgi:hypothetical protein